MRVTRYTVVSALGMGVQLAALWALSSGAGLPPAAATTAAVAIAVVHNFEWHRRWTWRDRGLKGRRALEGLCQFAAANGLTSLIGNVAISVALVRWLSLPLVAANLVAIAACGLINYGLADGVVFRRSAGAGGTAGAAGL